MKRRSKTTSTILLAAATLTIVRLCVAEAFSEYQVKAVFLFNFAQFVEWSPPPVANAGATFVIGVLGDDPFDGVLDRTVHGETIGARPFEVKHYRAASEATDCQILFVSNSEARQLPNILELLKDKAILTVSDADDFARRGGMVQFVTESNRIKLMINVEAARASNLTISSKLLRPAIIVSTRKN